MGELCYSRLIKQTNKIVMFFISHIKKFPRFHTNKRRLTEEFFNVSGLENELKEKYSRSRAAAGTFDTCGGR
ncbi:LOW QUALITY PROTEIN: hypothetical protein V1478_007579 [Vespula squamosa]|uniref:Uncharacterized protein n=1 Tax=Vespula squamosa TaxID=30214 RepID=A0ABD2B3M2_VESSQ